MESRRRIIFQRLPRAVLKPHVPHPPCTGLFALVTGVNTRVSTPCNNFDFLLSYHGCLSLLLAYCLCC
jgi:hypothetical protein